VRNFHSVVGVYPAVIRHSLVCPVFFYSVALSRIVVIFSFPSSHHAGKSGRL
jgi:hypothetical protein